MIIIITTLPGTLLPSILMVVMVIVHARLALVEMLLYIRG